MLKSPFFRIKLFFFIALFFLGGISVFSVQQSQLINQASIGRKETSDLMSNFERLRTLISEVEAGQRGFLLTEKKHYLVPYEHALKKIPILMAETKLKMGQRPDMVLKDFKSLEIDVTDKLSEMQKTIQLYQTEGLKASLKLVRTDFGQNKMDSIRLKSHKIIRQLEEEKESQYKNFEDQLNQISNSILAGAVLGVLFFMMAVSFLARAIFKQREAERESKKFASLVENSWDVIVISGTDGKIIYMNPAGKRILGVPESQKVEGLDAIALYTTEDSLTIKNEIMPATKEKGHWGGEFRIRNITTGEIIPFSTNFFPVFDPISNTMIGTASVSRDIRETKKLKRELDRFFEVSLDMLAISDAKGFFKRINPAFSEILGYSEAELCSKPYTEFVHPDDVGPTVEQLNRQAKGNPVLSFENRYRTKSGDYRWFSWKSFSEGGLTYGAARDVTDFKYQQETMKKLSREASASSQAKSEFLANMSHEIRTPLNGVIGMATLLLESPLSDEQREFGVNIRNSADSLLVIINDILDFSKIEAGKLSIEKVGFDLSKLIDETAKSLLWATKNKSLSLIVKVDDASKNYFMGDAGRIRQILTNLVHNAIKFTERGAITINCQLKSNFYTHTEFVFEVIDSGIGLSEESQAQLFQSFYQADASTTRKYGGTGLGLSICRRLVELMDGRIGVESSIGQGSKFWFTLPLERTFERHATKPRTKVLQVSRFAGARILVAEDNSVNQKILISILERMKFKPQAVSNGLEALAILRDQKFDLVLMDCQMPELDGYGATRKIRESTTVLDREIPIIAMTANALKDDRQKCLDSGMDDYTTKPVKVDELFAILETWLEKKKDRKKSAA